VGYIVSQTQTTGTKLTVEEIDRLLDAYYGAALRRDTEGVLATYAENAEHYAVGRANNPIQGKEALRSHYSTTFENNPPERITPVHRLYAPDYVVDEAVVDYRAIGKPFGLEGRNRVAHVRILHVLEFRDGLIVRDSAWFDQVAFQEQLR